MTTISLSAGQNSRPQALPSGSEGSAIARTFNNLRVKTKVAVGFFVVLALLVVVAVMAVMSFGSATGSIIEYGRVSADTVRASGVERDMVDLRRYVLINTTTGDEKAAARAKQLYDQLTKSIDEAERTADNAERKASFQSAGKLVAAYYANFETARQNAVIPVVWTASGENKLRLVAG